MRTNIYYIEALKLRQQCRDSIKNNKVTITGIQEKHLLSYKDIAKSFEKCKACDYILKITIHKENTIKNKIKWFIIAISAIVLIILYYILKQGYYIGA